MMVIIKPIRINDLSATYLTDQHITSEFTIDGICQGLKCQSFFNYLLHLKSLDFDIFYWILANVWNFIRASIVIWITYHSYSDIIPYIGDRITIVFQLLSCQSNVIAFLLISTNSITSCDTTCA